MSNKNDSSKAFDKTKRIYREYTEDITRERLGKELLADTTRIKKLYREAVGDDIDPLTGEQVGLITKFTRFTGALSKRLNPNRRILFGGSILFFVASFWNSGLISTALLSLSFMGFITNMILELLEKTDAKREIDFARDIQLSLLPSPEDNNNELEIASFANTANEVGGDYVDVIHTDKGTFVINADVSGKGLSASLYMVRMQAMVHLLVNKGVTSPRQLFLELNNYIKSGIRDKTFVTACACFFPKDESHFYFARAGHNPPILYIKEKDATITLKTPGLALGMAPTFRLEKHLKEATINFSAGDSLLVYTDGLNEARNADGQEYGEGKLISIMEIYGALDSKTITQKIQNSLDIFIGEEQQLDDITFSVIHKVV